jgi:hypothetical protein
MEKYNNLIKKYGYFSNFPESEKRKNIWFYAIKESFANVYYINNFINEKTFVKICKIDYSCFLRSPIKYSIFKFFIKTLKNDKNFMYFLIYSYEIRHTSFKIKRSTSYYIF